MSSFTCSIINAINYIEVRVPMYPQLIIALGRLHIIHWNLICCAAGLGPTNLDITIRQIRDL